MGARQGSEAWEIESSGGVSGLCYNWTISCPLIKSEILTCSRAKLFVTRSTGVEKCPRDIEIHYHMTCRNNLFDQLPEAKGGFFFGGSPLRLKSSLSSLS